MKVQWYLGFCCFVIRTDLVPILKHVLLVIRCLDTRLHDTWYPDNPIDSQWTLFSLSLTRCTQKLNHHTRSHALTRTTTRTRTHLHAQSHALAHTHTQESRFLTLVLTTNVFFTAHVNTNTYAHTHSH